MAQVIAKVIGGQVKEYTADTVGELAEMLGVGSYQGSINGEPADHDTDLNDHEVVMFAPKIKGA